MAAATVSPIALVLSSLAYFSGNLELNNPYVQVDTLQGRVRGVKNVARNGKIYMAFLGIPYAQPPIGDLRFEPPQPPSRWTGTREATSYGRSCLQYEFLTHVRTGAEDCLNLNVYTTQVVAAEEDVGVQRRRRLINTLFAPILPTIPTSVPPRSAAAPAEGQTNKRNTRSLDLKPVIVFLHGGLFMSGFPFVYRPKYFMEQDAVLVTMNYRVNSFGFLNTGDSVVRGNMGLKDQTMALKWVQQNIARFGGDPNRVTLMGQSAGAASVHFHLLSPLSSGLFHRAISQSGSVLNTWSFSKDPAAQAKRLGAYLQCPTTNSTKMIACMKTKSALEIERFHKEYLDPVPEYSTIFSPSVEAVNDEGTFLSAPPRELLEKGQIANRVPWIAGVNNDEGHFCALYLMKTANRIQEFVEDIKSRFPTLFSYTERNEKEKKSISDKIYDRYFNFTDAKHLSEVIENRALRETLLERISKLYSDSMFFNPIHDSIKYMAPHLPVYPYYFSFDGEGGITSIQTLMSGSGVLPRFMEFGSSIRHKWILDRLGQNEIEDYKNHGVAHADELIYLFNIPAIADEITPGSKYYDFSYGLIKLWMSFVKDGKPSTPDTHPWIQASGNPHDTLQYFNISRSPSMIQEPFAESLAFWKGLGINATNV